MIKNVKMRFFLVGGLLILASCSPIKSTSEDERHQAELTLHEVQTKVDDFQHDLSCYKTEFQILESKLENQNLSFEKLKDKVQKDYLEKIEQLLVRFKEIEQKNEVSEKQVKEALAALKELVKHADETTIALEQYRSRINDLEKGLIGQNLKMEEVKKIKSTLQEMSNALKEDTAASCHKVKKGESLDKIAKQYNVSVNSLRRINHLDEDLIMVGQELKIPSK